MFKIKYVLTTSVHNLEYIFCGVYGSPTIKKEKSMKNVHIIHRRKRYINVIHFFFQPLLDVGLYTVKLTGSIGIQVSCNKINKSDGALKLR